MHEEKWEVVDEVAGDIQAEILGGLLEAQGLQVWLSQEGAGKAIGLTVPLLGRVQILVPSHQAASAREILDSYYSGALEGIQLDLDDPTTIDKNNQEES